MGRKLWINFLLCIYFQACDAHSNEYIVSLRDEIRVCAIIDKLLKYKEEKGMPADICRVYLRKIEHLYYKYEPRAAKQAVVSTLS